MKLETDHEEFCHMWNVNSGAMSLIAIVRYRRYHQLRIPAYYVTRVGVNYGLRNEVAETDKRNCCAIIALPNLP
jgi:hypothetical protein